MTDVIGLLALFAICGAATGILAYSSLRGTAEYFRREEEEIKAEAERMKKLLMKRLLEKSE